MHWLFWLYFLLLLLTDVCGLALAAFTLPGLWLMLAGAAVYSWLTHEQFIGGGTLITLLVLAGAAEIGEIFLGGAGAKKAGGTKWGMLGGLVGGILGGFFLTFIPIPFVSTIIGICLGCFLGAFVVELALGQPVTQSAKIGIGAARGKFTGIVGKVGVGLVMVAITFFMGLPLHVLSHPQATTAPTIVIPPTAAATTQTR
jgi:uncharacterized protein YqgC (DUF456 family)